VKTQKEIRKVDSGHLNDYIVKTKNRGTNHAKLWQVHARYFFAALTNFSLT
jgi:hypothetical protein